MQEDLKDFVTKQPAAGALFTIVLGELRFQRCDLPAKGSKGTLRAAGTAVSPGRPCARLAGSLPAEDVALHPDGAGHAVAPRSGAGVVETVAARQVPGWLLGDEEGLVWCHVSLL